MIIGVGIDVCDVTRFGESLRRSPGLRTRLFAEVERGLPVESLAGRFAVKEALAKALGAPGGLGWHDAWVSASEGRPPVLTVIGTVRARADELGVRGFHVSISHDAGVATAIVIAEG